MGSDNSKPSTSEINYAQKLAVQRALEEQRRIYEDKCKEFMHTQIAIQESLNRQNRNNVYQSTSSASNSVSSTSTRMYPNLQNVENRNSVQVAGNNNSSNNPRTSTYNYPSSSNSTSQSTAHQIMPSEPPNLSNVGALPLNSTNRGAIPKIRSIAPHTSTVSTPTVSTFSQITPSSPPTSSNISALPLINNNNNEENSTNRGAIPKNRRNQNAQNKLTLMAIKCVTCKGDFGLQIFQCSNGHSSCSDCKCMSKMCGLCSKTILDMRNITLEATIADINKQANINADINIQSTNTRRMKCKNAKHGCSLSFTINEMGNHLKECPFNDIECPFSLTFMNGNCTWKGKINQMSIHMKEVHPQNCLADVDIEMILLNINTSQKLTYFVKIGSFNFFIHIKVDNNEKVLYMTAQLLGTKVSASKWTYELHVYNKREPKKKFQYTDVCYSNTESVDEIFNRAQCAVLTKQYAETFVNNGLLNYKFFLKKKNNYKTNEQSN